MDISFETQRDIVIMAIAKMKASYDLEDFIYNTELAKQEFKTLANITKVSNNNEYVLNFNLIKKEFILEHDNKSNLFKQQREKEQSINQDYKASDSASMDVLIQSAFSPAKKKETDKGAKKYTLDEIESQIQESFSSPLLVNANGSLNAMTKKLLLSRLNNIKIEDNNTRKRVKALLEQVTKKGSRSNPTNEQNLSVNDSTEHKPIFSSYKGEKINIAPLYAPNHHNAL